MFNADFRDFIEALRRHGVRYVLVKGYSVILHGYSRITGDLDIWVEKSAGNYDRLARAFHDFGMPTFDITADNFLHNPAFDVFTFGRLLVAIDIITRLKGLEFVEAFAQAADTEVEGLSSHLIHYQHLLQAKRAAGRPRDQNDLDNLTSRKR